MTSMTAPNITHPAWCDRDECYDERPHCADGDIYHWSATATADVYPLTLRLVRVDDGTGQPVEPTRAYLNAASHDGPLTLDDLDALGRWLTERAAEYRAAIIDPVELCSETVIDEDTDLTVGNGAGFVYMVGAWPPAGRDWRFTPAEARAFGHVLITQAARAEG